MAVLLQLPKMTPTSGGVSYNSAKAYYYQSGTTTPITVYTSAAMGTPHNSPVVADANGVFAPVYIDESVNTSYRLQLYTSADVLIYDVDSITSAGYALPATIYVATGINLGHASDTTITRSAAGVIAVEGVNQVNTTTFNTLGDARYMKQGLATIPILASAMQSATTNGAAAGTVETTTNRVLYKTLDFDQTTQEFAGFVIPMPKSWNDSTVTFQPLWTFASSSGGVVWALQAVACSDDDTADVAYGTEQTSTDTALTAGDVHVGPTSAAITIAGSPATNDLIFFRIKRNPSDASDTLAADARLIGIRLFFTQNAADDT